MKRWRHFTCLHTIENRRHGASAFLLQNVRVLKREKNWQNSRKNTYASSFERHLNVIEIGDWTPAFGDEAFLRDVDVEKIERMIDRFDFRRLRHP